MVAASPIPLHDPHAAPPAPGAAPTLAPAEAPLPTLSDADASTLLALLNATDPDAEAVTRGLSQHQVFELLASPAAERYLAARARFDALRRERRQDPIRDEMLTVLRTVAKDESRDPVERRRAASAALRTLDPWRSTNTLLRALARPHTPCPAAALKEHAGAPGAAPAPTTTPPNHKSPPHLPTSSPPHPPSPPASSVPGLHEAVAAFIRAAGTTDGLQHAATHVAVHRKRALGPNLEPWLRDLAQRLAHAEVVSGFTLPQDILDCAVHAVTLTRPQGPLQALVHVVLERHPDGRNLWAVADVVTADSS
ncbi:MAG: hypothetical protein ACKVU4_02765 [Phycisphaerales bacterium]